MEHRSVGDRPRRPLQCLFAGAQRAQRAPRSPGQARALAIQLEMAGLSQQGGGGRAHVAVLDCAHDLQEYALPGGQLRIDVRGVRVRALDGVHDLLLDELRGAQVALQHALRKAGWARGLGARRRLRSRSGS
jgi:hypothetical protein